MHESPRSIFCITHWENGPIRGRPFNIYFSQMSYAFLLVISLFVNIKSLIHWWPIQAFFPPKKILISLNFSCHNERFIKQDEKLWGFQTVRLQLNFFINLIFLRNTPSKKHRLHFNPKHLKSIPSAVFRAFRSIVRKETKQPPVEKPKPANLPVELFHIPFNLVPTEGLTSF